MTVQDPWESYGSKSTSSGPLHGFFWDWYQRDERGTELLGDVADRNVVEVGAGAAKQAALVAGTLAPARVTAIDSSSTQHARAREIHADCPRLRLVHANAADYLQQRPAAFNSCFSVFGAVDFTNPHTLLPAIANALAPAGLFVFSTLGHFHNGQPAETDVQPTTISARHADGTPGTMNRWVLDADRDRLILLVDEMSSPHEPMLSSILASADLQLAEAYRRSVNAHGAQLPQSDRAMLRDVIDADVHQVHNYWRHR